MRAEWGDSPVLALVAHDHVLVRVVWHFAVAEPDPRIEALHQKRSPRCCSLPCQIFGIRPIAVTAHPTWRSIRSDKCASYQRRADHAGDKHLCRAPQQGSCVPMHPAWQSQAPIRRNGGRSGVGHSHRYSVRPELVRLRLHRRERPPTVKILKWTLHLETWRHAPCLQNHSVPIILSWMTNHRYAVKYRNEPAQTGQSSSSLPRAQAGDDAHQCRLSPST